LEDFAVMLMRVQNADWNTNFLPNNSNGFGEI
jgi:hypothetical protein